jgi:hypothetical protein
MSGEGVYISPKEGVGSVGTLLERVWCNFGSNREWNHAWIVGLRRDYRG